MTDAIWTEKYRPKTFKEVKGQDEIVSRIEAFVKKQNMPHLLFAGRAGTGKTSLSLVIAKEMFGDSWKDNFLELNASDERGIDIVRVKVKDFARTKAIGDVPFKIIYLDECLDYDVKITIKNREGEVSSLSIGEFIEKKNYQEYSVLSVNDSGNTEFVSILGTIKLPHEKEKGFYSITVHDKQIKITGNHLIITPDGWKRVDQLSRGEKILCPLLLTSGVSNPVHKPILYQLVGLPQEIKKKERYIFNSPEKSVVELLAKHPKGLSREKITQLSGIRTSKLSSILSPNKNKDYLSLLHYNIIGKKQTLFTLNNEKNKALSYLYKAKREQRTSNYEYVRNELAQRNLYPISKENSVICASILGHLFSDGSLSLKAKQLFFSGKEEDLINIKKDINKLGFHGLGNIRYSRWRKGECWSFGAYRITLLSLFYSLGAPVGKKTDTYYNIPDWIMHGDKAVKREFLATFFGGDGTKPKFQGRTIKPIVVGISKREDLLYNLKEYLQQIKELLMEFGIKSKTRISPGYKTKRQDGTKTIEGRIWITNSIDNILSFLEKIGYKYCKYKEDYSKLVVSYLLWKKSLGKGVYSFRPIPHFDEWQKDYKIGNSAFHYISDIIQIKDPDFVYCLKTTNQKFIANDIIVHNCDALTKDAQQALRRTMENYTKTCRFILSCNYSSKILDPIQSRCAVFRFKPLADKDLNTLIDTIAKNEKLNIDDKAKKALVGISHGDARRIMNIMQASAAIKDKITEELIYEVASVAKPEQVKDVLEACVKGDFNTAKSKMMSAMLDNSLSGLDMIKQISGAVWDLSCDDSKKLEMIKDTGEAEFRMIEGADEYIQIEALLAKFVLINQ